MASILVSVSDDESGRVLETALLPAHTIDRADATTAERYWRERQDIAAFHGYTLLVMEHVACQLLAPVGCHTLVDGLDIVALSAKVEDDICAARDPLTVYEMMHVDTLLASLEQ